MKAVLLSAGLGTRLRPITERIPKPCVSMLNIPHIYFNLLYLKKMGVTEVYVNTYHLHEYIAAVVEARPAALRDLRVTVVREYKEILGTGGGIKNLQSELEKEKFFFILNSDLLTDFSLQKAVLFSKDQNAASTLVVCRHPELGKKYGAIYFDENSKRLTHVPPSKPEGDQVATPIHFMGIQVVTPRVFSYLPPKTPCDMLEYAYARMIQSGEKIFVHETDATWFDTGTVQDYVKTSVDYLKILQDPSYDDVLKSIYMELTTARELVDNIWIGKDCQISDQCTLIPPLVIGSGVKIDANSVVGPYAVISDHAHVGKNASVKRSLIYRDSKVVHDIQIENKVVFGPQILPPPQ